MTAAEFSRRSFAFGGCFALLQIINRVIYGVSCDYWDIE